MRKTIKVLLVLLSFMFLVSCQKSDELLDFTAAFKNYNYNKTAGHRYTKTQRLENIIICEEQMDLKINRKSPLEAHKYYYLKELDEFDLEKQFTETTSNEYYYKDSIGTLVLQEIVWEKKPFKDFSEEISLPNFKFKKQYLGEHTLTKLADYLLLRTEIKDEYTKDFFLIEENIKDVYFEARIKGKKLQEFKITFTLDKTVVELTYKIYYEEHELNINYE